jgi:hypothetical protein
MAGHSTYLADGILNHLLRAVAFPTIPATIYWSLHTGDPGLTGASEVASVGAYARVALVRGTGVFDAPSTSSANRQSANSGTITFPAPTGTWGVCTYVGLWDASTGGNFLIGFALDASRSPVNLDNAPSFAIGALIVKE